MFNTVIITLERTSGVVWWTDVDALDLAGGLLFEGLEGQQVVAEDEAVIEQVVVGDTVLGVVGLLRILQKNPRLQLRPGLLADPR